MNAHMFIETISALEEKVSLMGIDVKNTKHPLIMRLGLARESYASGDKTRGRAGASYINFLLEDLATIANANKDLYQHFVSLLRQEDLPLDNYFGIRCEIRTAASITSKNIDYEKAETPDFIVKSPMFGIECSSAHLNLEVEKPPKGVFYKVLSSINEKSSKHYSTGETILVLDVSNLLYHDGRDISFSVLADMDRAKPRLKEVINTTPFSSLLYFYYSWIETEDNKKETRTTLTSRYVRVDSKNITTRVRVFLDQFFPLGNFWVEASVGLFV